MKPPFLLLAKSRKPPAPGEPWWCITEDQVLGHSVLYLYSPGDWPSRLFDGSVDMAGLNGGYVRLSPSPTTALSLLWVRSDPEGFNDAILIHEAVHLADGEMEYQEFEGTELRAHLTEMAVRRVWATRNEPKFEPNAPMLDHIRPVVRDLRRLDREV